MRLKNDYKDLMARIETGLVEHHARLAQGGDERGGGERGNELGRGRAAPSVSALPDRTAATRPPAPAPAAHDTPFARVNSVAPDGPAREAGLQTGDAVIRFGWVDCTNHEGLRKVADTVSQSEGVSTPPAWLSSEPADVRREPSRSGCSGPAPRPPQYSLSSYS